jgi:pyruvate/2-oxoglutarate dehydrogenase complex dihydrolipoamide acyltransferase (E2) component
MSETHLAMVSSDGVLRLITKHDDGVIEEKAALALAYELDSTQLLEMVDLLLQMTTAPAPAPVKTAAPPKAKKAKAKKPAEAQRKRRPNHSWLSSAWLIRFVRDNPGLASSEVGKKVCAELGQDYVTANKGGGGIVTSRLSNLTAQKKLSRDQNGGFFATEFGLEWARATHPEPVPEGQELLAE